MRRSLCCWSPLWLSLSLAACSSESPDADNDMVGEPVDMGDSGGDDASANPSDGTDDGEPTSPGDDGSSAPPPDGSDEGSDGPSEEPPDDTDPPDEEPPDLSGLDEVCTPEFELDLRDSDPTRVGYFMEAMDGDPEGTAQAIGREVCKVLYRRPEEVRDATRLTLIIEHAVGDVAWKAGDGGDIIVMISTDHIQNVANAGRDVAYEVKGVLYHEMTHMYQHDDSDAGGVDLGLIEGIADFVRFSAGYPPDGAEPNPRGNWNDGYRTTAFFLMWVDEQYPGFVYKLNLSMTNKDGMAWSPDSFREITGYSAEELWEQYVQTF